VLSPGRTALQSDDGLSTLEGELEGHCLEEMGLLSIKVNFTKKTDFYGQRNAIHSMRGNAPLVAIPRDLFVI
jgi:hypothetical protein